MGLGSAIYAAYTSHEILWMSDNYDSKADNMQNAISNFTKDATSKMDKVAESIKQNLKEKLGDKYDEADVTSAIDYAKGVVIEGYTTNIPTSSDDNDDYNYAYGKHAMVFDRKSN